MHPHRESFPQQKAMSMQQDVRIQSTSQSGQSSTGAESDRGLRWTCKKYQHQSQVYGRVSAEMDIRSRQDVSEFIQALQNSRSTVLSSATSGYHYHLIEASSEERLDLIRDQLEKAGFLAPLQPWEQHTEKGNIKL